MHPECRREERREYWRQYRSERELSRASEATARKIATLKATYERRVARARAEAVYYRDLYDSALWRLLTRKDAQWQIGELLQAVLREEEPVNRYQRNLWLQRQDMAGSLLWALQNTVNQPSTHR